MYACDYLENGILNALRGVTFAAPAKCYLALYLNDPGETGAGGTEVSYTGYKRMEIDFSAPADSNGGIGVQNLTDITFPTPVSAAGTITHIGVVDSLTGGNMLARGELVEPLIIGAEEPPVFLAGDVLFYLTGNLSKAWKTKVLNILRGNSIQGITPYFSLWNGSPESSGSELSGDNYQRAPHIRGPDGADLRPDYRPQLPGGGVSQALNRVGDLDLFRPLLRRDLRRARLY